MSISKLLCTQLFQLLYASGEYTVVVYRQWYMYHNIQLIY